MTKYRKWSEDQMAEVLNYARAHGRTATLTHYKLSGSVLHRWAVKAGYKGIGDMLGTQKRQPAAKSNGHDRVRDAIVYLRHARAALPPTPKLGKAQLLMLLALETLEGA